MNSAEIIATLTGTDASPTSEPAASVTTTDTTGNDVIARLDRIETFLQRLEPLVTYAEKLINSSPAARFRKAMGK